MKPARPKQARRVALVDRDKHLHAALRHHLAGGDGAWELDAYAPPAHAWKALRTLPPQVVLLDLAALGQPALGCVRRLKAELPGLPVVVLSGHASPGAVLSALTSGAWGYLLKPLRPAEVLPHLHRALSRRMALCPQAECLLLEGLHHLGQGTPAHGLTHRHQDILHCLSRQLPDKAIATDLGISEATVHAHLARIYRILNVNDRAAAVAKFLAVTLPEGESAAAA